MFASDPAPRILHTVGELACDRSGQPSRVIRTVCAFCTPIRLVTLTQSDTGKTSPSNHVAPRPRNTDIVADDDQLDVFNSGRLGHQPRKAEMEVVARVCCQLWQCGRGKAARTVCDDQDGTDVTGDFVDRSEDLLGARTGKHVARNARVQQGLADEPDLTSV